MVVGVREDSLLSSRDFNVFPNTQAVCEPHQSLGTFKVDAVSDAARACRATQGCTHFSFFSLAARPDAAENTAYLCGAETMMVVRGLPGWVTAAVPSVVQPEERAVSRASGPLML